MTTIRLRRDTSVNWAAENPVLLAGEQGYEVDTRRYKIGDGFSRWNSLDYYVPVEDLRDLIDHQLEAMGLGAGLFHVHTQSVPAATWTISHGLSRMPHSVSVFVNGELVETDTDVDDVYVTLTFAAPIAGEAHIL